MKIKTSPSPPLKSGGNSILYHFEFPLALASGVDLS